MSAYTAVVTSKGQLVIPAKLRKRLGIKQGTVVSFVENGDSLILQPVTPQFVKRLRGSISPDGQTHGKDRS